MFATKIHDPDFPNNFVRVTVKEPLCARERTKQINNSQKLENQLTKLEEQK